MKPWSVLGLTILAFVLIPFALFGQSAEAAIAGILTKHPGPHMAGFLILVLVLDVVLPVPSSLVSSYACQQFGPLFGFVIILVGMTLALVAAHELGRLWGASGTRRILGTEEYERAATFGNRRGAAVAVALSRAIPVLSEAVGLLSGGLRWPRRSSFAWGALASAGVASAYALLFFAFGQEAGGLQVLIGSALVPAWGMLLAAIWARRPRD